MYVRYREIRESVLTMISPSPNMHISTTQQKGGETTDSPDTQQSISLTESDHYGDDGLQDVTSNLTASAVNDKIPAWVRPLVRQEIDDADKRRQLLEDQRANRRNRNRSYTILVALFMTFAVPYLVANVFHAAPLLKYATGIAIIPDGLITLYAWYRKY